MENLNNCSYYMIQKTMICSSFADLVRVLGTWFKFHNHDHEHELEHEERMNVT